MERPNRTGHMDRLFKQVGARYLGFVRKRYVEYARGGGDWPPLKRKRKHGKKAKASVLIDTGTLLNALTIGAPGNLFRKIRGGIRVGFGGPHKHPEGKATIADIAGFHNTGEGNLPERRIIVEPDRIMHRDIQKYLHRALNAVARKSSI